MTVAETIASQIGHRAFVMMGTKYRIDCGDSLMFDVGRNSGKVTKVIVKLAPDDTYEVKFFGGRGLKIRELESVENVYVDSLHETITTHTGLYLTL